MAGSRPGPRPVVYWFASLPSAPGEHQLGLTRGVGRHRPAVLLGQRLTGSGGVWPRVAPTAEADVWVLEVPRHLDGVGRRWPVLAGAVRGAALRCWLARRRWWRPIVVFGMPQRWSLVGVGRARVLDLHDPPLPDHDRRAWWRATAAFARRCRLVVTTARALHDGLAEHAGLDAEVVPNATLAAPAPEVEPERGRTVGYVGAVDWRMDAELLAAVADEVPGVHLHVLGRVTLPERAVVEALAARPNVTVHGMLTGDALARVVEGLAVGLNPVRPGWYADCLNPTKAYEYAVHGVACVSTDVAEARTLPHVVTAADRDGFVAAVAAALDDPPDRAELRAWGNANTWDHRGDQLEAALVSAGLG